MDALERFDFDTDRIVISGVSVGLPGKARRVFAADNFDRILEGTNFIEPLTLEDQKRITDKNITRLFKQARRQCTVCGNHQNRRCHPAGRSTGIFQPHDEYV